MELVKLHNSAEKRASCVRRLRTRLFSAGLHHDIIIFNPREERCSKTDRLGLHFLRPIERESTSPSGTVFRSEMDTGFSHFSPSPNKTSDSFLSGVSPKELVESNTHPGVLSNNKAGVSK